MEKQGVARVVESGVMRSTSSASRMASCRRPEAWRRASSSYRPKVAAASPRVARAIE